MIDATEAAQIGLKPHAGVFVHDAPQTPQIGPLVSQNAPTLADCEAVIKAGTDKDTRAFIETGRALQMVKDNHLFTGLYDSFEDYLKARWPDIKKPRARQYIKAAENANKLFPTGSDWLPGNEGQSRALNGLTPEEAGVVALVMKRLTEDGRITAAKVASVIDVLRDIVQTGAIDGGDGEDIPLSAANLLHLKARVAEEVYERYQRHIEYIAAKDSWKRVSTVVVEDEEALDKVLWAIGDAYEKRGRIKISYYVEKEEQTS